MYGSKASICVLTTAIFVSSSPATAQYQVFPPGTFFLDGYPIICGYNTFILDPGLPDVGMNNGMGEIRLNPMVLSNLPTVLKLYWVGHECGHTAVGFGEAAADCWSVTTGRDQGWFPPEAFDSLELMFRNNPGDMAHPSGPERVDAMVDCYFGD